MLRALFAAIMLCGLVATSVAAQTTVSAKSLVEALRNPDLMLADTDPKAGPARKRVTELLMNQPTSKETPVFNQRLALIAMHKDTRLGRLFFAVLAAAPDVESVPVGADTIGVTSHFPLALGSGAQVRLGWTRSGEVFKISEFAVEITGNAGALFTSASPYFAKGDPTLETLNEANLDYLLGRDPADRLKLEAERAAFDYDAALKKRFAIEAGAPAALLNSLSDGLAVSKTDAEKMAIVSKHLASEEGKLELARAGTQQRFWDKMAEQLKQLAVLPCPSNAPAPARSSVRVTLESPSGQQEWMLTRLAGGELGLGAGRIGLTDAEGEKGK